MTSAPKTRELFDVCIIGAGPSGSALAIRLAQLGHEVCLIERSAFPRPHIGESLSPGIWPLLDVLGARRAITTAHFRPCRTTLIQWGDGATQRRDLGSPGGLLVDRGRFDALLLDCARAHGVRVIQPAVPRMRARHSQGWHLDIETAQGTKSIDTHFLADASGRSGVLRGGKQRMVPRTLALFGYWTANGLPQEPRIEAGDDEWYWGVPLPDGTYNAMVFADAGQFRARPAESLDATYHALIGRSGLMGSSYNRRLVGPVRAADATPYVSTESVGLNTIKVGEAALALDPLSSTGVQKAVSTALTGAIVLNTLLRSPQHADAAHRFYKADLATSSDRHRGWAAGHYAVVAGTRGGRFWQTRAVGAVAEVKTAASPIDTEPSWSRETSVALSPDATIVDQPCIVNELIATQPALQHPGLERPVAFLGGWKLATLLKPVRSGIALGALMDAWQIPFGSKPAVATWLLNRRVLKVQHITAKVEEDSFGRT